MFLKLLRWIRGYLLVEISASKNNKQSKINLHNSPERFINMCSYNNIYIWNLKNIFGNYQFEIVLKDYKRLKAIVRKTHILPHIKKKNGLPFIIQKYKKKKAFIIGLIGFFLMVYILSLNIWNISINGGRSYTKEIILEYLHNQDIYIGKKISNIDCRKIEENIRENYKDIGWVSAEIKGTNLIIDIRETIMPQKETLNTSPSHIIAKKNGIITKMVTRSGTPLVKVGDTVKKGDILVSGVVDVIGDNELIVNKEPVISDADIVGKTYYKYKDSFSVDYKEKKYTKKSKTKYKWRIFSKEIKFYKHGNPYKKCDIITNEHIFQPIKNLYLPFSYTKVIYEEYIEVDKRYQKEEALNLAESKINLLLNELVENDVVILEHNIKTDINNDYAISVGEIIVEESLVDYKKVYESEWRIEEEDELNGDSN